MWDILLLVVVLESRDFSAMQSHVVFKILWRYLVFTHRDLRPLKEKLIDSLSHSLTLSFSHFHSDQQSRPTPRPASRGRDRCPRRESAHHPLPHLWSRRPVPSDPIHEAPERPLPSVIAIHATDNSDCRSHPSASDEKHEKHKKHENQEPGAATSG
jgi:hypothetical protein